MLGQTADREPSAGLAAHGERAGKSTTADSGRERDAPSTCDPSWITHRAILPAERTGPGKACFPDLPGRATVSIWRAAPGPTPHSIDRVLPHPPVRRPGRLPRGDGSCSLGALLRNTREQGTNLGLPVAPVSPQRAD